VKSERGKLIIRGNKEPTKTGEEADVFVIAVSTVNNSIQAVFDLLNE
jgi:hypothetical protein